MSMWDAVRAEIDFKSLQSGIVHATHDRLSDRPEGFEWVVAERRSGDSPDRWRVLAYRRTVVEAVDRAPYHVGLVLRVLPTAWVLAGEFARVFGGAIVAEASTIEDRADVRIGDRPASAYYPAEALDALRALPNGAGAEEGAAEAHLRLESAGAVRS